MVKAILWDNDGILVETEHLYFEAGYKVLKDHGVEMDLNTYKRISLVEGGSVFQLIKDDIDLDVLRAERDEIFRKMLIGMTPMPGVVKVLEYYHGKLPMAVITSSKRVHFETAHETTGLLPYFDFVLCAEDYENSKPFPEPYLKGAAKYGFDPSECAVVEDTERGVTAALAAGMQVYACPNELSKTCDFTGVKKVLGSIEELIEFL